MTKDKELLLHLRRIADALEEALPLLEKIANPVLIPYTPPTPPPPAPPTFPNHPYSGYRCGRCGTWVMTGVTHACSGWIGNQTSPNACRAENGVSYFPIAGTAVGETFT